MIPDEIAVSDLMSRGVADIINAKEFRVKLEKGDQLRLKMGFDPSTPDIHLGHVVGLRKLRQMQRLGHKVVLIVGDWTAQIGDPSGKSATRPMLSREQVQANATTYLEQFFRIVSKDETEVVWQSEWFENFGLSDVLRLTSHFTIAQLLQRNDFRQRWESNRPVAVTELLYPLLQAYDSVKVHSDVEFGGTDQTFNLMMGRQLQEMWGQSPQQCFTVPILVGTDGSQKMSKSLGNYIGVSESPETQYGKLMSIPDTLVYSYFELLTDVSGEELECIKNEIESDNGNPMFFKKELATNIVSQLWSPVLATAAQTSFERVFQRREDPQDIPAFSVSFKDGLSKDKQISDSNKRLSRVLIEAGLAESISEVKRLLSQGAVEIDGKKETTDLGLDESNIGSVIRVGKHRFIRLGRVDER